MNLNDIKSPADIKKLNLTELDDLCARLRAVFLEKISAHGGHVGPNLGVVEATVALHYVFDAPEDKLVFDVSHQTYIHKMLTGRIKAFTDPAHYDDVTGYTNPRESEYDLFSLGHTSCALSLAGGLALARDLKGGHENVVAFIGDGAMSGGEAFEGLDSGASLHSNFIVVFNDNQMSIAENHGGIYEGLKKLRDTNGQSPDNIFRDFGYGYVYVRDGNNLSDLIRAFESVKGINHPVVVHINTMKGYGLPVAEADKEKFHWSMPFSLKSGSLLKEPSSGYPDLFARHMLTGIQSSPDTVVITAGTPGSLGFTPDRRREAGRRFIDVGIAEQDAVATAAGLAKGGIRPVVGVMATFLQRAYDQLHQEVGINRQPVVVVTFGGGVYGVPDETHLGFFDIAMISNIPNIVQIAPTDPQEFTAMIDWALAQNEVPVVVRCPSYPFSSDTQAGESAIDPLKYKVTRQGERVALIAEGGFYCRAEEAAALLEKEVISPTLVKAYNLSTPDTEVLDSLKDYDLVMTLEDGIIDGGFGQKVATCLARYGTKVICKGIPKEFLNDYRASELIHTIGVEPQQIADEIKSLL